jgi:anti-sigma factor RsiW
MKHEGCRHLLGSLSEYVDGELDGELCAEIERHLEGCDNCRIVVDSLRKTIYLYRADGEQTPLPGGLRERLFLSLQLEDQHKK